MDSDEITEAKRSKCDIGDKMALGFIDPEKTVVFVCDMQERFGPSIQHFTDLTTNIVRIVKTANILGIPVIATEQYPKGLGKTVPQIAEILPDGVLAEKTKFTMCVPAVTQHLQTTLSSRKTIILVGIEAHVCIMATCIDLVKEGYTVHVVANAVGSRSQLDRQLAFDRMKQIGCFLNSAESVILSLVQDAKHPKFKEVQALIKELCPETGLVMSSL